MASASGYNHQRFARAVLKKSRKWEPSMTVQLYPNHWRFENSAMTFQYDGPMKPFLIALRSQVFPASLMPKLYSMDPPISFVDGCLVVEIQDFRKNPEVRSRVVMRPAAEDMAQTIKVMLERRGEKWDEQMSLELESRIISATSPPLYLGTSILATRNALLSLSLTSPAGPNLSSDGQPRASISSTSLQHPSSELEATRKLLRAGERNTGQSFQPNWSILRLKERMDGIARIRERELARQRAGLENGPPNGGGIGGNGTSAPNGGSVDPSASSGGEKKVTKKKKRPAASVDGEAGVAGEEKKPNKKKKTETKPDPDGGSVTEEAPKKKKKKKVENAGADVGTVEAQGGTSGKLIKDKVKKKKEEELGTGVGGYQE